MSAPQPATRTTEAAGPGQHGGRPWLMLTVLLVGQFMGIIDAFIVNVAMPEIGRDLHASGATLQMVIGGYTAAYAMLLITGARLGSLYGRRRMYQLGAIVFTAASLGCGLAPDSAVLVTLRFIQGAGAAVMIPQIISVIQMRFTGEARAKAMSWYGAVLSSGAVVGLVIGGALVSANLWGYGWRAVFFVNVPLGVALAFLVPVVVPADQPGAARRLDMLGLVTATAAVFAIVTPLVLGQELGWPIWTFLCIAAGLVLAVVFVRIEQGIKARGGDPLLDLGVVAARGFGAGMAALGCMQIAYGALLFIFTLHLESGLGDSPLRAGLSYIAMSGTFGLAALTWRRLPPRVHPALGPAGMVLCALGYLFISVAMRGGGQGSALMWIALVIEGGGMGLAATPLLTQSLSGVPMARAADASGLLTTVVQMSQVVGVAAFGTVYLSLLKASRLPHPRASAGALSNTTLWLALLCVFGVYAGLMVTRSLRANRLSAATQAATAAREPGPAVAPAEGKTS